MEAMDLLRRDWETEPKAFRLFFVVDAVEDEKDWDKRCWSSRAFSLVNEDCDSSTQNEDDKDSECGKRSCPSLSSFSSSSSSGIIGEEQDEASSRFPSSSCCRNRLRLKCSISSISAAANISASISAAVPTSAMASCSCCSNRSLRAPKIK